MPDLDPPPTKIPASKRRRRRRRRPNGADALKERGAPAVTTSSSKRQSQLENTAADSPERETLVTDRAAEKTHTDAQGGLHGTSISKPENNKDGDISTQRDSPQKAEETHLDDSLVQTTSKLIVNSNENFQPGNKEEVHDSTAGTSSHAWENFEAEIKAVSSKSLEESDIRCSSNNCSTPGNSNVNLDYQNEDPACPGVKNDNLAGDSGELKGKEDGSYLNPSCLKDEKKKRKKTKRKKNNHVNTITSQDPHLPTGTDTSGLMTMVAENNTPGFTDMGLREKQNLNEVAVTKSFTVDNAKSTEGKCADVGSTTENKYDVVQPRSLKETVDVAKLLDSCTLKNTTNLSLMPLQGVGVDKDVKQTNLNCTFEEKNCQSVCRPYIIEGNHNLRSTRHMREAVHCQSYISTGTENAFTILPPEDQGNQLNPFNEGANFFQIGNLYSNYVLDIHQGLDVCASGAMWRSEYELESYLDLTGTERNKLLEKQIVTCLSADHITNCICHSSPAQAYKDKVKFIFSPRQSFIGFRKKKLLILDLNGLLADINQDYLNAHMADAKVRGKLVFRRPYCDDFLNFCLQNFELGIWSSRKRENVDSVIDILMKDLKPYLLFSWDQSKCTFTGFKTLENRHKPLMLKELRKLWNKEEPGLPWEEGEFSPSNTLLVDDSPYKALHNPPHTAIFPHPYNYLDWNDSSLGPGGDLRVYLENLVFADDVEGYVRNHPFGQPFITESDPHWNFYAQIAGEGCGSLICRA